MDLIDDVGLPLKLFLLLLLIVFVWLVKTVIKSDD